MKSPEFPANEKKRQAAVEKYQLLDTLPEDQYDDITSLMSYICDAPISLITLLDKERNFLKSHHGVPFNESPREFSFCGHAINSEDPVTIIEDARVDDRFFDNPLVTDYNAVFYAGAPLIDSEGFKLGTLCVFDQKPRKLTEKQLKALTSMSRQVVQLFELRYQNFKLIQAQDKLKLKNEDLRKFAGIVSHDLKSPLANIISLTELLEFDSDKLDEKSLQCLTYLKTSSNSLKNYIDGILEFYLTDHLLNCKQEHIDFESLILELGKITKTDNCTILSNAKDNVELIANKAALMQILINLITNAIKYNSKPETRIEIRLSAKHDFYEFSVKDNSDGIPKKELSKIFDLFSVVGVADKYGNMGTGIGLATVKRLIQDLGGDINVSSKEGHGSTFTFTIAKIVSPRLHVEA
ncbi:GAF sensor signal transduction histidine kinase [Pricia antarctica]|uniref:histidine kinase n=1 Tax=Pricia antarctica TaxID=641691 RepID=A0A1G7C385_9FLAO|nr:GAF domain-containing sensor histidine kinase [Pricia antarctica]SDE33844.1 GAF sensor signal transduction histidine kinase [Pricia antarctica]